MAKYSFLVQGSPRSLAFAFVVKDLTAPLADTVFMHRWARSGSMVC